MMNLRFLVALLLAALTASSSAADPAPLTASDYKARVIEGWTVKVEKSLFNHPRRAEALDLIQRQLAKVAKSVPPAALPKLKKVPIWLSRNSSPGAAYHPSADWLKANGRVVEMARSIEIQNIDNFIDWSEHQPLMLQHELSHAWHHRFVEQSYDNPTIKAAYDAAALSGNYESVQYYDGSMKRHYALTNPMEYFAECSEAYFGKNDFQPFNRKQLKDFDPNAFRMVRTIWGIVPP